MFVHHVCLVPTETKRALDPLELELQADVNLHVGAANEPLTSARAASVLLTISYLSNPKQLHPHNEAVNTRNTLSDTLL